MYIIITFINSLLLILELLLSITPLFIRFPSELPINTVILIMIGMNFIISVLAYVYVGIKLQKTNNIIFDIIITLLPFIFACPGLIIINCNISNGWEYVAFLSIPSWGTLIISLYNTFFKYIIAIFPSICISIGYIIKYIKERRSKNNNQV